MLFAIPLLFLSSIALGNPIPMEESPREPSWLGISLSAWLICLLSLTVEATVVALLTKRPFFKATICWLAITALTFGTFVIAPLQLIPEFWEMGIRSEVAARIVSAETMIVLAEAATLWVIWFPPTLRSAYTAFGISLAGNVASLAVGLLLFSALT